jgi:hypothetical protein
MLSIPIVSQFDNKGVKSAQSAFKRLGSDASKAGSAIKSAFLPATLAVGALAAAGVSAAKAAIEDEAAQAALARQIRRTTKATDAQIAANEDWIETQGKLLGVTDDELRPALAGLVRATGSITKAQKAASLAMDISAAKGVSLQTVTKSLERAYGGNLNALAKLSPEVRGMIRDGASLEEVMAKLADTFEGDASDAAKTTEGRFKKLKVALDEAKEELGKLLLPALEKLVKVIEEKVLPYMDKLIKKFKEDGLSGALKMATADLGKFISKLDGAPGVLFNLGASLAIVFAGFKAFGIVTSLSAAFTAFGASLSSVASILGVSVAVGAGAAAAAFAALLANVYVLVDALRDDEFRPVFLTYLLNTLKLVLNVVLAINNAIVEALNLVPRLANFVLPGNPVGLIPQSDYFQYDYGTNGPSMQSTPSARRRSVPDISGSSSTGRAQSMPSVTVNTGIGDPVAIGRAVSQVLDTYNRRAS